MLNRWWAELRALLLRGRLEREMREELEQHLAQATERLMGRGLTREEAEAAAGREFGALERIREDAREARGGRWMDATWLDMRYAIRQIGRRSLSSATIVLVLALGIGSNVVLFAVFHSMATQPPPGVEQDAALVRIRRLEVSPIGALAGRVSFPEVQEYARQRHLFEAVAAWGRSEAVLDADGTDGVEAGTAEYVTGNYFRVLGVRPILGDGFSNGIDGDASQSHVGVISHVMWNKLFGRSPEVLGRALEVNGVAVTVVGVAPPRFTGADDAGRPLKVWLPLAARAAVEQSGSGALASYDSMFFSVAARLQPTVTAAEARPAVEAVAVRASRARVVAPPPGREVTADVVPMLAGNASPRGRVEVMAERTVFGGITTLVLLITCTTASTVLVGLAVGRRQEIAVRLSLGASRSRIVRQLVTESMLLATAAGGLALLVTHALIRLAETRFPDVPLVLSWPTAAFMLALAVATGLLFGLSPALHGTRLAVAEVLKDSAAAVAASRSWLQRGLVVAQIGLTQPMLVGLGAFVLIAMVELDGRIAAPVLDEIVSIRFRTPLVVRRPGSDEVRTPDGADPTAMLDKLDADAPRVRDRIAAMPGVRGVVSGISGHGFADAALHPADRVPGSPEANVSLRLEYVTPGYFDLLDAPIVAGRDFTADDHGRDPRAAILGSDLARDLWGSANPIGRRFVHAGDHASGGRSDSTALVVVGVVDANAVGRSEAGLRTRVFVGVDPDPAATLLVRTDGAGAALIPAIRRAAVDVAPDLPIVEVTTLGAKERETQRFARQASGAAAAGGLLALFLSAIGLYAVVAFAVGQRTREIGIRTALGASRAQVVARFFAGGLRLALLGLAVGLPLSLLALRVFAATVDAAHMPTFTIAVIIAISVTAVAAFASWIPARRAAAVDPLIALRSD